MSIAKFLIAAVLACTAAIGSAASHEEPDEAQAPVGNPKVLNCSTSGGHPAVYNTYTCPVGGEKFRVLTFRSYSTWGRHLDWEPVSYRDFPMPLPVCPSNGLVLQEGNYTDEQLAVLASVVASPEYQSLYEQKHASFYLFIEFTKRLGVKFDEEWYFLLQATWEADGCNDADKYKLYALAAIEAGKKRLEALDPGQHEYWTLNVVIPNLYRRMGDFGAAQTFLDHLNGALPEDDPQDFFAIAFRLLQKAITDKSTAQVAIKRPEQ